MRILGVDFGLKKIGLAISEGKIAEPLGTVKVFSIQYSVASISKICQKEGIEKIVVGVSEGKMAKTQKKFGEELAKTTALPVEFWDETLTSKEAVEKMIEAGKPKKKRKTEEHAVAAALILQNYLESQKE